MVINMNLPLISVIIPVYNVEKYLIECLDSVVNQTYKNIEIILINDGSTDNSGEICNKYSNKDSRIVVIHKDNEGVSAARNTGLDAAKGEYIGFVDSDDLISENYYESLYNCLIDNNSDVSVCNLYKMKKNDNLKLEYKNPTKPILNQEEAYQWILSNIAWRIGDRIYRKDVISNIRFKTNFKIGEDFSIIIEVMKNVKTIAFSKDCFYYYRQRNNSAINSGLVDEHSAFLDFYIKELNNIKLQYPNVTKAVDFAILRKHIAMLCLFTNNFDVKANPEINEYVKFIRKNFFAIIKNNCFPFILKCTSMLLFINKYLFKFVYKTWNKIEQKGNF